jgi:hypothetical protein
MNIINPYRFGGSSSTLKDGLVSWWSLNESSGTRSDSHGSNDLVDSDTTGSATGKVGSAARIDSSAADKLTVESSSLQGGASFTVAGWIYLDSLNVSAGAWFGATSSVPFSSRSDWMWAFRSSSGLFQFYTSDGGWKSLNAISFGTVSSGTWYHVTTWYDSDASTMSIKVNNGATDSRTSVTATHQSLATTLRVGGYHTNAFDGRVDELGFWSRVLTANEITELYNSGTGIGYSSL